MQVQFHKYQGAGNDFILIDDRNGTVRPDISRFNELCNRRFGVGADGIMLLRSRAGYDFEMLYFNADGREGSMCGNGGRCIVRFARDLGIIGEDCSFLAVDGPHTAKISDRQISLGMQEVTSIEESAEAYILNTGSPHYVCLKENLKALDVVREGRAIRYNERFREEGINVNFVEPFADRYAVRTYERGVEDETYACGTGVTAVALAMAYRDQLYGTHRLRLQALGGSLEVSFERVGDQHFKNIYLTGPAEFVYRGEILI